MSNAGARFYPSGCGGHKNLENAATFSKLLGQEDKLSPALPSIEHGARPVKDTTGTQLISESGEEDLCRGEDPLATKTPYNRTPGNKSKIL